MINQLRQIIIQKDEEIKKAQEALKWFKLELVNREGNYNKLFNAQPNVGVMNPLESKVYIIFNIILYYYLLFSLSNILFVL